MTQNKFNLRVVGQLQIGTGMQRCVVITVIFAIAVIFVSGGIAVRIKMADGKAVSCLTQFALSRKPDATGTVGAGFSIGAGLLFTADFGELRHHTGHGITAIENAVRATNNLDLARAVHQHVIPQNLIGARIKQRYAVND